MLNKEWRCPDCDNYNYRLAGKWKHLKSKKHIKDSQAKNEPVVVHTKVRRNTV